MRGMENKGMRSCENGRRSNHHGGGVNQGDGKLAKVGLAEDELKKSLESLKGLPLPPKLLAAGHLTALPAPTFSLNSGETAAK